ncbi:MAG: Golgi Transport [Thelocarpon superellum]|nr:MAG: Golgi Transport [Thelocarpon superellum]
MGNTRRSGRKERLTRMATMQILFVVGMTLIIGPQKTLMFFARRQKLKGTAAFVAGILLILLRWPLVGFCVELYGLIVLFWDFVGTIAMFVTNVPVIGPYVALALDRIGAVRRNSELPV